MLSRVGFIRIVGLLIFLLVGITLTAVASGVLADNYLGSETAFLPLVLNNGSITPQPPASITPTYSATPSPTNTSTPTVTSTPTETLIPEYGKAIVGFNLGDGDCTSAVEGVKFGGTGSFQIDGGGVFSNGCLSVIGDCDVTVTGGAIDYAGGLYGSCPYMNPPPTYQNYTLSVDNFGIPQADCTGLPDWGSHSGSGTIYPGIYSGITINSSTALVMEPGLYCLTGNIRMTGGYLTGNDLTIYMQSGNIYVSGGEFNLTAPISVTVSADGVQGVLIYVDPANSNTINMAGNSASSILGVIFAPTSDIALMGTGDIGPTINSQILGYNVSLLGVAELDINFPPPPYPYPK